jgi:hypothetical protein
MEYWYYFWLANFLIAGSAFVAITVVVLLRGIGELRAMFAELRHSNRAAGD